MEAASRPPLELLPDQPVEAPSDAATARQEPPTAATAAPPPATTAPPSSADTGQTGLNFVDPEMFLAPGAQPSAIPFGTASAALDKGGDSSLELVLEDPVVDEVLTAPPPPPPAPAASAPAAKPVAPPRTAKDSPADAAASLVPIARTASLTAAAAKLAAANRAATKSKPAAAAPAAPAAPATSSASPPKPAEPPAAKIEAPSLASWASARAAAAAAAKTAGAPVKTPAPAGSNGAAPVPAAAAQPRSVAPKNAAPPLAAPVSPTPAASLAARSASAPAPAAIAPPAAAVPPAPTMDRDFIARNQIVERYLSGRLPLKAATEFERFCGHHPELLDELGLPERVNAGLRLLEASGKPEPWQEAPPPLWLRPPVTLGLSAAAAVLAIALAIVGSGSVGKSHRIAELQKQANERALDPATSTREIRVLPSRSGASNSPAITIGAVGSTQLADLKIDESRSPYHAFRVTIDRIDQGRVGIINNLGKDSNGHLRVALNSSALGPGNYLFTLEGLDWRGAPQPDSWVTIGIAH
jgi:hypothetical protein